jgi:O-acetyl-ADP-ribose deacetylase
VRERIGVLQADITLCKVDAIVNAASPSLLGGGGVDGAIHRAAGPDLLAECRELGGCASGHAKITSGHDLPATWVIHTVGPVWTNGENNEDELLASCYRSCLELAVKCFIRTIAFPSISTGAYHFPFERAARIALRTVVGFLGAHDTPTVVWFVCYDPKAKEVYERLVKEMFPEG